MVDVQGNGTKIPGVTINNQDNQVRISSLKGANTMIKFSYIIRHVVWAIVSIAVSGMILFTIYSVEAGKSAWWSVFFLIPLGVMFMTLEALLPKESRFMYQSTKKRIGE